MPAEHPDHGRSPAKIRVVVVDDDASLRSLLALLLGRNERIEPVGSAADGAEALRVVAASQPDVVLLDLMLVGERGTELIAPLLERAPRAMIAMLTAMPAVHEERACLAAGAFVFYEKHLLPGLEHRLLADYERFRAAGPTQGHQRAVPTDDGRPTSGSDRSRESAAERRVLARGDARLRALAQSLVELIAGVLEGSAASLWWHDDEAAYQIGRYPDGRMRTIMPFAEMPDVGASIRAGELQVYERQHTTDAVREWMDEAGIEVSLRVPVPTRMAPRHFLGLSWASGSSPPLDEVVPLAKRFAEHVGIAWTNAMSRQSRHETVLELSDNVAQALVAARGAFELGEIGNAQDAVDRAYAQLERILVRLLDEDESDTVPEDVVGRRRSYL